MNRTKLDAEQELKTLEAKDWEIKILASVIILLYVGSALVGAYFLFRVKSLDTGLAVFLLIAFAAITLFTVLACFSLLVTHKKIMDLRRELLTNKACTRDAQERVKVLRSLFRISTLISQNMEISRVLDNMVTVIKDHFNADQVSLMLRDLANGHLDTKATAGEYGPEFAHVAGASVKISEAVAGWIAEKGEALLLDKQTDFTMFKGYFRKMAPINSSLCVPLHFGTRVIGVVNVNRLNQKDNYTRDDLTLLTVFANDIALAIENARLIRELKSAKTFLEIETQEKTPGPKEIIPLPTATVDSDEGKRETEEIDFQITTEKLRKDIAGVYIKGQLNALNSGELDNPFHSFFKQGIYKFVVDLSQVNYVSSAGAGIFMSLVDTLQAKRGNIVFVQLQPSVKRTFHLLGLLQIFSAVNTRAVAVKLLSEDKGVFGR